MEGMTIVCHWLHNQVKLLKIITLYKFKLVNYIIRKVNLNKIRCVFNLSWFPLLLKPLYLNPILKAVTLKFCLASFFLFPKNTIPFYFSVTRILLLPVCQVFNQSLKSRSKFTFCVKSLLISLRKQLIIFFNFFYNSVSSLNNLMSIIAGIWEAI